MKKIERTEPYQPGERVVYCRHTGNGKKGTITAYRTHERSFLYDLQLDDGELEQAVPGYCLISIDPPVVPHEFATETVTMIRSRLGRLRQCDLDRYLDVLLELHDEVHARVGEYVREKKAAGRPSNQCGG